MKPTTQTLAMKPSKLIIIAAKHATGGLLFSGTLDDLTKIACAGNGRVFYVDSEFAAQKIEGDDEPSYPAGEGWYFNVDRDDEPELAESQLAAVCAVLGDDCHFFRVWTKEEAIKAAEAGIPGHFGIEAQGLLQRHLEQYA